MAIKTQPAKAQGPGGGEPAGRHTARPWWRRAAMHTAVAGAVLGYLAGHLLGNFLGSGYQQLGLSDFSDLARQVAGRPPAVSAPPEAEAAGLARYFRYSLDHKVVGIQYLVGMIIYFCTAGLFAMAIRTELLSPTYHIMSASSYLVVVGEHGTMMMMLMSSVVLGPFGNFLMPLMIGSKLMAFPRLEALSFWLTPAAFIILLSGILL